MEGREKIKEETSAPSLERDTERYAGVHGNDIGCKHVGSKRGAMSCKQLPLEVSARDRLNKRMPPKAGTGLCNDDVTSECKRLAEGTREKADVT